MVPTSGEHYFDSSGENCWQGARWHAAHLKLAMHGLFLADPLSLHHGRTSVQLLTLKSVVELQTIFAQTSCAGKVKLVLRTRCTGTGQEDRPELHGSSSLDFGARGVCLSWMNKRQTCCQLL